MDTFANSPVVAEEVVIKRASVKAPTMENMMTFLRGRFQTTAAADFIVMNRKTV